MYDTNIETVCESIHYINKQLLDVEITNIFLP